MGGRRGFILSLHAQKKNQVPSLIHSPLVPIYFLSFRTFNIPNPGFILFLKIDLSPLMESPMAESACGTPFKLQLPQPPVILSAPSVECLVGCRLPWMVRHVPECDPIPQVYRVYLPQKFLGCPYLSYSHRDVYHSPRGSPRLMST